MERPWKSRHDDQPSSKMVLWGWGTIEMMGGRVYVDGVSMEHLLAQFGGRLVAYEFVFGLKHYKEFEKPEEKILPLVEALNAKGVKTFSSCQGHLEPVVDGIPSEFPYVDYWREHQPVFEEQVLSSWEMVSARGEEEIYRLQPKDRSLERLVKSQEEALELAQRIR